MEILNLLFNCDNNHVNLTAYERTILAVIITFVNGEHLSKDGYKAWPSKETLMRRTGIGSTAMDSNTKSLETKGWITKVSGKGKGSSNTYFVSAGKIVSAAKLSGFPVDGSSIAAKNNIVVDVVKEQHIRNTSGLVQNQGKAKFCQWLDGVMYDNEHDYQQALEDSAPF